jgi:hypothetical protein
MGEAQEAYVTANMLRLHERIRGLVIERDYFMAECDRLRAALGRITRCDNVAAGIARRALEETTSAAKVQS